AGARSLALANGPRAALRKPVDCTRWVDLRIVSSGCDPPHACGFHQHAAESGFPRPRNGLARPGVYDCARGTDYRLLRIGACLACHAGRACHATSVGEPWDDRRPGTV